MLDVFVGRGIRGALDEHGIGNLFRRQSLLLEFGHVVEEQGLNDLYGLLTVNLQGASGLTVYLALAGFIRLVLDLLLGPDRHKAGMDSARVLFVPHCFIE